MKESAAFPLEIQETDHGPRTDPDSLADPDAERNSDAAADQSSAEAQMITGLLILALLASMWAETRGNRAARPLLASAALTCALTLLGVQFELGLWLMIDAAVIVAIERTSRVGDAERAIFALFPPAWVLYHLKPAGWSEAVALIVALQFLLTVPWDRVGELRIWKARMA